MPLHLAADLLLHLTFILFVVLGGLLTSPSSKDAV
jgi:hypothetical protein